MNAQPEVEGEELSYVEIAAGLSFSLAVSSDGELYAWGRNQYGQLGDGTTNPHSVPAKVPGLENVKLIAAGEDHCIACTSMGTIWSWGGHIYMRPEFKPILSDYIPNRPFAVSNKFPDAQMLAAGSSHNLILTSEGEVWEWGSLPNPDREFVLWPRRKDGLTSITMIDTRYDHSIALDVDGIVWTWGDNSKGQLGDTQEQKRQRPAPVAGLDNVAKVAAGVYYSLALHQDGSVWAWGDVGSANRKLIVNKPMRLTGLEDVADIYVGYGQNFAIQNSGDILAWGTNRFGQIGNGHDAEWCELVSINLNNIHSIKSFAGCYHTLCLESNGQLWAWGDNVCGELGDGTTKNHSTPVRVK